MAVAYLPSWRGFKDEDHVCTLPKEHLGLHKCWCECLFTDDGTVFSQKRLPIGIDPWG